MYNTDHRQLVPKFIRGFSLTWPNSPRPSLTTCWYERWWSGPVWTDRRPCRRLCCRSWRAFRLRYLTVVCPGTAVGGSTLWSRARTGRIRRGYLTRTRTENSRNFFVIESFGPHATGGACCGAWLDRGCGRIWDWRARAESNRRSQNLLAEICTSVYGWQLFTQVSDVRRLRCCERLIRVVIYRNGGVCVRNETVLDAAAAQNKRI